MGRYPDFSEVYLPVPCQHVIMLPVLKYVLLELPGKGKMGLFSLILKGALVVDIV